MDAEILHYKTEKQEHELHVGIDAPARSRDSVAIATELPHIRVVVYGTTNNQDALNNSYSTIVCIGCDHLATVSDFTTTGET